MTYHKPIFRRSNCPLVQSQGLTLSSIFCVSGSCSYPAASTHCFTASPSRSCSLISRRYSSAFWLSFCIHQEIYIQEKNKFSFSGKQQNTQRQTRKMLQYLILLVCFKKQSSGGHGGYLKYLLTYD